ncbi:MAG: thermonuclease family protein [Lacibacter sp.]
MLYFAAMRWLFLAVLIAAAPTLLQAQRTLTGRAVKIIDGDTFDLLVGTTTYRIRLQGIDCPERGQPYSRRATEALGNWCRMGPLTVRYGSKDRNGRILGDVYTANGTWINLKLVEEGWAWHFTKYSSDGRLRRAEAAARSARRGLWQQGNAVAPWDWRRGKR